MSPGTKDTETRKVWPRRLKRWLHRGALVVTLLAIGGVLCAGAAWIYRAPILEWAIKNRIEATGATATLSVAVFDTRRLTIHDIHIGAPVDAAIKSLELEYDLDAFLSGRITAIRAAGLHLKRDDFRGAIEEIAGDGDFALGFSGISRLQANLDILRATLAGEPIHPSRLILDYRDNAVTLETTIPSSHGFIAVLGQGSLTKGAPPYRITLSGRLDPALFPFLAQNEALDDAVSFTLNIKVGDLLAGIDSIRPGAWVLPDRFSVDGELELDLGRVTVAGNSFGIPGRDHVRFRFDDMRTKDAVTRGSVAIDIDVGPRKHREFEFARANFAIEAGLRLSADKLELALKPGSQTRVFDLQDRDGLQLEGETAFQLVEADNHVILDLKNGAARHRLQGRFNRKDGQLDLRSEGDLSAQNDPVVFTLKGKIDTAPILALLPGVQVESGSAEIFVAGEATALLPQPAAANTPPPTVAGSLRLDGALTLHLKGATLPGMTKAGATADRITFSLKGFEATHDWQRGRFSLSAKLAPRRLGSTAIQATDLSLDGQLRSTARGYRFHLERGGALQLRDIRSPLLTVPDALRLQLAGKKNTIETDKRFRPTVSQLRFAHVDARGALIGRSGQQEPFRLSLPGLTSAYGKNGHEYQAKGGTFTLPRLAVAARGVSLDARMGINGVSATIAASGVRHRSRRPLVSPVSISARATLRNGKAKVTIRTRQLRTPLTAKATIEHDLGRNSGRLRFTVPRFKLEDRRYRFGDMFPIAVGWFDTIRGGAAADGELNWDRDLLSGRATVTTDRVDLAIQDLRIDKMSGAMDFIELAPLLMPPRQRFTGNLAFSDIGPLPFRLEFQLNEDGRIAVQDLDIKVGGGRMRTRGIVAVQENGISATGKVEATSIGLQDALRILGIEGLNGSGRVSGTFPIVLQNDAARIVGGRLIADGPGRLNYSGNTLEHRLIGAPKSNAAIIRALSDFRFKSLSMELDKDFAGIGTVVLRLNGTNPAIYEGNAFTFDMRVASDLRKLERLALGGLHTSSDVSRQADGPSRKR